MTRYNIYYNNEKINKTALTKEALDTLLAKKHIFKFNKEHNDVNKIDVSDINIIKCTVI